MATPAAILSLLVKTEGATVAAAELRKLNATGSQAHSSLSKLESTSRKTSASLGGVGREGKKSGTFLRDIGHGAAYALGAGGFGGGLYALFDVTKKSIKEFRESQTVSRQTGAVLKSTGNAAGVTAKDVEKLANAIKRKTGIDDETIQSGENMLLTFTKIRNEAGRGNKIFDEATQSITDMAVAMNNGATPSSEQLSKTAILVGKALNDPIKGSTALRRVGVALTQQQQDQIKVLEAHGHHLEAQKILLRELTTEFGGSAAAQATAGKKLQTALGDLAESAGALLAPAMEKVATVVTAVVNAIVEGSPVTDALKSAFSGLLGVAVTLVRPIIDLVNGFRDGNTWAVVLVATLGGLTGALIAYRTYVAAVALATNAWARAQVLLDGALALNPYVVAAAAIIGLGVALAIAYQKSEAFRHTVQDVGHAMADAFSWIIRHWPLLVTIIAGPFAGAASLIAKHGGEIVRAVTNAFSTVVSFLGSVPQRVSTAAYNIGASIVNGVITGVSNLASWLTRTIENSLVTALTSLNPFSPVEHGGEQYIGRPLAEGALKGWVLGSEELPAKMSETVRNAVMRAKGTIDDLRGTFNNAWSTFASDALGAFDAIMGQQKTPAETQIASEDAKRERKRLADDVAEAQKGLDEAVAGGDPEAIQKAQKVLDDALWAQKRADLEEQAKQERKQLDAQIALRRRHFQKALDALQKSLSAEGASRQEAHARILKLFKRFGVDYTAAGTASGEAFATGMQESESDVEKAASDIAEFVSKPLKVLAADIVKTVADAGKKAAKGATAGAKAAKGPAAVALPAPVKPGELPSIPKLPKTPELDVKKIQIDSQKIRDAIDSIAAPFNAVANAAAGAFNFVKDNWPLLAAIILGPIPGVIGEVVKHFGDVKDAVAGVFNWVVQQWPLLAGIIIGPIAAAAQQTEAYAKVIKEALVWAFRATIDAVKGLAGAFTSLGEWVLNRIVDGIHAVAAAVINIGGWIKNRIMDGLEAFLGAFLGLGSWVINRVVDGLKATTAGILSVGGWIKNRVLDGLEAVVDSFLSLGGWVIHRIVDGTRDTTEGLLNTGNWLRARLADGLAAAKDGFLGLGGKIVDWIVDGLRAGADKLVGFLNDIIDVINKIPGVDIGHVKGFKASASGAEGDAQAGAFARGGIVNKPMAIVGEEAPLHNEYVIPTNPAYRGRALGLFGGLGKELGVPGFAKGGIFGGLENLASSGWDLISKGAGALTDLLPSPSGLGWLEGTGSYVLGKVTGWIKDKIGGLFDGGGGASPETRLARMMKAATDIAAQGFPYVYGGGHNPTFSGPFDCSGAVSAVLHAGGYISSPMTTDGLKTWGSEGPGPYVTIGVRGSTGRNAHTMMRIGSKYFEAGGGHGAAFTGGWDGDFPINRHPPGLAKGGVLSHALMNPNSPLFVGWGLRHGGMIPYGGSFGDGGVVPGPAGSPRMILAHGGEEVGSPGRGNVYIDKAVFGSRSDPYLLADRLAWRLSVG